MRFRIHADSLRGGFSRTVDSAREADAIAERFTRFNPGAEVVVEPCGLTDAERQLQALCTRGGPDLVPDVDAMRRSGLL